MSPLLVHVTGMEAVQYPSLRRDDEAGGQSVEAEETGTRISRQSEFSVTAQGRRVVL